MQGVAELVEQRRDLIEAQQRGLTRRRLGDVQNVDHHRFAAEQL